MVVHTPTNYELAATRLDAKLADYAHLPIHVVEHMRRTKIEQWRDLLDEYDEFIAGAPVIVIGEPTVWERAWSRITSTRGLYLLKVIVIAFAAWRAWVIVAGFLKSIIR